MTDTEDEVPKRRLKVMFDHRMQAGGAGRYAKELVAAIKALPQPPTVEIFRQKIDKRGKRLTAPFTPSGRMIVAKSAARWGANVVHGLHFEIPPKGPFKKVVTIQDLIPLDFPASMPNRIKRWAFTKVVTSSLANADAIIVPSKVTAESVSRRGADPERIKVIPLWPSVSFRPSTEEEIRVARNRFSAGRPYVACLYHRKPHKNMRVVPEVARILAASSDLILLCSGHPSDDLHGGLPCRPLSEEELRLFVGGADVFLLPSLVEGFGLPVVEAAACGINVVCSDQVGAVEVAGGFANTTDVSDPNAIVESINKSLEHNAAALSSEATSPSKEQTELPMSSSSARSTVSVYNSVCKIA